MPQRHQPSKNNRSFAQNYIIIKRLVFYFIVYGGGKNIALYSDIPIFRNVRNSLVQKNRKNGIGMAGDSLHYIISVVVKGCLCLSICIIYN